MDAMSKMPSSSNRANWLIVTLKSGQRGDNGPSALQSVELVCKCVNVIVKLVETSAKSKMDLISDPVIHKRVQPPPGRNGINGVIAVPRATGVIDHVRDHVQMAKLALVNACIMATTKVNNATLNHVSGHKQQNRVAPPIRVICLNRART